MADDPHSNVIGPIGSVGHGIKVGPSATRLVIGSGLLVGCLFGTAGAQDADAQVARMRTWIQIQRMRLQGQARMALSSVSYVHHSG